MKLIIQFFGIVIFVLGILFLVNPETIYNWSQENTGNFSFYIAVIVVRLTIGIILIIAAKQSRYPLGIKFIGYMTILGGLVVVFLGHQGFQDLISSMIPTFELYAPLSGLTGILFGGFLVYAFVKSKEIAKE